MAITLDFFNDAGLTQVLASLDVTQADDGNGAAADRVIYLGSPTAGKTFRDATSPGAAQIAVSISDSAPGSGPTTTAVKLALSSGGLAGATAGAALNVGTTLLSGAVNAIPVYVRIDTSALAAGVYSNLGLTTSMVIET